MDLSKLYIVIPIISKRTWEDREPTEDRKQPSQV